MSTFKSAALRPGLLWLMGWSVWALTGCSSVFYYPSTTLRLSPAAFKIEYHNVSFQSHDGTRLHGWFIPATGPPHGTVVFFHGNAENISTHYGAVAWLTGRGYHLFLFDYRGYGQSSGVAKMSGIQEDARAAIEYVRTRPDVDPNRLILFGQSLGGAIAVYAVAEQIREGIRALVIESTFTSYRTIAREKLAGFWPTWPLQWPLALLISDRYSPLQVIHKVSPIPVLIIHGDADEVVPYHHAERLLRAAGLPKTLWTVPGGHHADALTRYGATYQLRLIQFLNEVLNKGA